MTDVYTSFCHCIQTSKAEMQWLLNYITNRLECSGCGNVFDDPNLHADEFSSCCQERLFPYEIDDMDNTFPAFRHEVENENLYLLSDQGGVDQVAEMLREFLARFRPQSYQRFEWSHSAEKLQVGANGGGAAFITALKIETFSTQDFLHKEQDKWDSSHGNVPAGTPS
jgi:hypothetical protein